MRHAPLWLVPAAAGGGFALIWLLDANRALFLALNALGPATSDWLWANITVLGDTVVAFALCLPLWRRRPELVWAFVFLALLALTWPYLSRIGGVTNRTQLAISTGAFFFWVFSLGGPFVYLMGLVGWTYHPIYGGLLLPLYTFAVPILDSGYTGPPR